MASEDQRSVFEIGEGQASLAITLPKPWMKFWRLKKRDKMLLLYNGVVVIIPPSHPNEKCMVERTRRFLMEGCEQIN